MEYGWRPAQYHSETSVYISSFLSFGLIFKATWPSSLGAACFGLGLTVLSNTNESLTTEDTKFSDFNPFLNIIVVPLSYFPH